MKNSGNYRVDAVRRRLLAGTAGIVGAAALGMAPRHARAQEGQIDPALVEAAKQEGEIVPYESVPQEQASAIANSFTDSYDIPNKLFRAGQTALQSRIEAEIRSGNVLNDTVAQQNPDMLQDMAERGLLATDFKPVEWDRYPAKWRQESSSTVSSCVIIANMIYNNKLVDAADAPTDWEAFVSADWQGKAVIGSPEYSGSMAGLLGYWVQTFGWDYIRALKTNNVHVARGMSDADTMVTSGQKLIGVMNGHRASLALSREAPLTLLFPPALAFPTAHAVMKDAPHPNAARLYINHILSLDVQNEVFVKVGLYSAHPDAETPEFLPPLDEANITLIDSDYMLKHREELMQGWRDIMRG